MSSVPQEITMGFIAGHCGIPAHTTLEMQRPNDRPSLHPVFYLRSLKEEFQLSRLYIHGLQDGFLTEHNLEKLEALSGGAALVLARLEGDIQYYKSHFDKLAISYAELSTKESFLGLIAEEIPLNITLESNQRSEAKAALHKKTLEQTEMNLVQIIQETEQTAEAACRDYSDIQQGIFDLTKAIRDIQGMERDLAEMKKMDDQYRGMTMEHCEGVLEAQTLKLKELHQELDEMTAEIEDLKWQETQLKESNQRLVTQRIQLESQAKDAIRMSTLRRPEIEEAYRACLEATKQYREDVGLESIEYLADSSSLILEYKIQPGSAALHTVHPVSLAASSTRTRSRKPILTQILIKIHPKSGRLVSASVENAGCDVKDVIQAAKARNDISFLVMETLDRVLRAHP
ncbi:MAG: hypothetical protein J3Q66DRAFT_15226 [Benniella sp.]|nr:MAG: hypothetical protein J3Q66DRAFT_15226 [Benniella sp.]